MDTHELNQINPIYNIVSTMAYLIGVDEKFFSDNDLANFELCIYNELQKNKEAEIIRYLCHVRTGLIKYFGKIKERFKQGNDIGTVPDYICSEYVNKLEEYGIKLRKGRPEIYEYIIDINKNILAKIYYVKDLFPLWFNWEYIRELFIMPNGTKSKYVKNEIIRYSANKNMYPFQSYINWPGEESGNILHNDEKFAISVYKLHNETFTDKSFVRKERESAKLNINEFISSSQNVLISVDCENADPFKFAAFLISLSDEEKDKIRKIMMYNSDKTPQIWETVFDRYLKGFRIKTNNIKRLNMKKSQVDMSLAVDTTKEICQNGIDAVILVSSDSDYWALIKNLPETRFIMMLESDKSGKTIRKTLQKNGYQYCYIDEYYTGETFSIKSSTIKHMVQKRLDENAVNIKEIIADISKTQYLGLSEGEQKQMYNSYVKAAYIETNDEGIMRIVINGR